MRILIKIKPNSGTEMAGVKVRGRGWQKGSWVEIVYVGEKHFFSKNKNGLEDFFPIKANWEEYKETKYASPAVVKIDGIWGISEEVFFSKEEAKDEYENFERGTAVVELISWPAMQEIDGKLVPVRYLIEEE